MNVSEIAKEYYRVYNSNDLYESPHLFTQQKWFQDNYHHLKKAISILGSCKCCLRHQEKRPKSINSPEDSYLLVQSQDKKINNRICSCQCRHLARKFVLYANGSSEYFAKQKRLELYNQYTKARQNISTSKNKFILILRSLYEHIHNNWTHIHVCEDYDDVLNMDFNDANLYFNQ